MPKAPRMTADQARALSPGDAIDPQALWNNTERPLNQLPSPCIVVEVQDGVRSESGVVITVKNVLGKPLTLDAGWFKAPK